VSPVGVGSLWLPLRVEKPHGGRGSTDLPDRPVWTAYLTDLSA